MKATTAKRIITDILNEFEEVTLTIEMNNGRVFVADVNRQGDYATIAWDDEDPTIMRIEVEDNGTKWIDADQIMSIEI